MNAVQCRHLRMQDFAESNIVKVLTQLASHFEVEQHRPGIYIISPCPDFPRGTVIKGLDRVRSVLITK